MESTNRRRRQKSYPCNGLRPLIRLWGIVTSIGKRTEQSREHTESMRHDDSFFSDVFTQNMFSLISVRLFFRWRRLYFYLADDKLCCSNIGMKLECFSYFLIQSDTTYRIQTTVCALVRRTTYVVHYRLSTISSIYLVSTIELAILCVGTFFFLLLLLRVDF